MTTLQTVQRLLVEEFELAAAQVTPEAKLAELGVDSLATIEFMFRLEEEFKIDLGEDQPVVETVADVAAAVDRLLETRGALAGA